MTVPLVRPLTCPSCGAAIESHLGSWLATIACSTCGAVLDPTQEPLSILQGAEKAGLRRLAIPLGSRGTFDGEPFEAVGFQERTITVEGIPYRWREYVLFNPYLGFRYLSEYDGHWNQIVPLEGAPPQEKGLELAHAGTTYRHFQSATAETTAVLGEFPWEVRRGDRVLGRDFVAPPLLLSEEQDGNGITWSLARYTEPEAIAAAFAGTVVELPPRTGVFANQPSPWAGVTGRMWRLTGIALLALMVLVVGLLATRQQALVFTQAYEFTRDQPLAGAVEERAFVTPIFTLRGSGNVRLTLLARLDQAWLATGLALINANTGTAWDTGLDVGRYSGVDGGESWSEGSYRASVRIPAVPPGDYYLRVAPEGGDALPTPTAYTLRVERDTRVGWYAIPAVLLLLVPALLVTIIASSFETRRWMESDHAPASSGDDDDE